MRLFFVFEALKRILAETKRGFEFACDDYWRINDHDDMWVVKEILYNHKDKDLPDNLGKFIFQIVAQWNFKGKRT